HLEGAISAGKSTPCRRQVTEEILSATSSGVRETSASFLRRKVIFAPPSPWRARAPPPSRDPRRTPLDGHGDPEDRSAREPTRRLVLLAHGVAAVVPHAKTVAAERELARLGLQRALRHDLVVDVELGVAQRLPVGPGLVAREFQADRVLAL